ncbi:MAG: non-heme ferritin [Planctomycetota bacterium]|nr:non-heme ferritin [Planctomycetota bacterium]
MISSKLSEQLNTQIGLEQYSSNLYLQMSAWCESEGLTGCAGFMRKHADEEMEHMQRLFQYVVDTGARANIGAIPAPRSDFKDIKDVFETTLAHEETITTAINSLVATAFEEKDFSTFHFLQWYVAEQHEEEGLFKNILDRIRIIGTDGTGLFMIDQEVGRLGQASPAEKA